jgi:6,7-dimethyl-8-ribityllumazine synthase
VKEIVAEPHGHGLAVGIVRSRFNEPIGKTMLEACLARLAELGVQQDDITVLSVPGALEAPLALQKLGCTGRYHALIALGAVIRGETYHFEIVSNESASGISAVALDLGIPIANGILTANTDQQAEARAAEKGGDCAQAAVEMANLARSIDRHHR